MATKDDEPPNSGLWGHVEVEALPNPGSLPPPPGDGGLHRGTLLGFVVPPPAGNSPSGQTGPFRRTPTAGTAQARAGSKTLTSGVVPQPPLDLTVVPATSPIGGIPKDTMLAPGGEPQPRGYYHSSQATRTLIGGSVPVTQANQTVPTGVPKRGTAPGFSTLPETRLDKNTLMGVALPPTIPQGGPPDGGQHPTYRSPSTHSPSPSTDPDFRAVGRSSGPPTQMDMTPGATPAVTSHLGRFRIQKRLGSGGVGAVYLASKVDEQVSGHQLLAVKVLREHFYRDPSTLKALFREARLAARMDHRHIVRVFDIGYHNKHPYLVMEYVDGLSLTTLLNHSVELPLGVGIRCLIDTLHGLDFAHKLRGDEGEPLGLVHCDVSPQNILVGVDGVTKLTDFGVARTREEDGDEFVLRCKPEFAAPELLRGEPVRPETDVFSAGAVLYRIATGVTAFTGETEEEVADRLLNEEPVAPTQVRSDLPAFLDAFCAQAMAKSVNDRFRTCLEMARALERQADAAGLLADRVSVGAWVQNVRRAIEHGDVDDVRPQRHSRVDDVAGMPPTLREHTTQRAPLVWGALALGLIVLVLAWWLMGRSSVDSTNDPGSSFTASPMQDPARALEPASSSSASEAISMSPSVTPLTASVSDTTPSIAGAAAVPSPVPSIARPAPPASGSPSIVQSANVRRVAASSTPSANAPSATATSGMMLGAPRLVTPPPPLAANRRPLASTSATSPGLAASAPGTDAQPSVPSASADPSTPSTVGPRGF